MSKIGLQVHAEPVELLDTLLPSWLQEADVHLAIQPDSRALIWVSKPRSQIGHLCAPDPPFRLILRPRPFHDFDLEELDFLEANPGALVIKPGRVRQDTLTETYIGAVTENEEDLLFYRRMLKRARKSLSKGSLLINTSGERHQLASHLYSPGALALQLDGVVSVAGVGGPKYIHGGLA